MNSLFATARSMLEALRTREISAQELLDMHFQRIARYNAELQAIVTLNEEQARHQAQEADVAIADGTASGALHGLPVTIKDSIEVAGLPATSGLRQRAEVLSTTTAPVARSVLDAGAILLGKTNLPTQTADWQTENALFGRTNNPWDLTRTPGGSTGGGAAALAAGLTPLEFGSDLAGSLRIPPAFCGLYGHRPSETAVPRSGHIPGSPYENPALVMSVMGPLARSASDLSLALTLIAGPVSGEEVAWQLAFPPARQRSLADFRVAVLSSPAWLPIDTEIGEALDDLVTRLRSSGTKVEEACPETFDLYKHHEAFTALMSVITFADLSDERRVQVTRRLQQSPNPFAKAQIHGVNATATQFLAMHGQRTRSRMLFREFFQNWDVLLSPVTITPAFPHISSHVSMPERTLQINGKAEPYMYLPIHSGIAAYNGLPATVFPWGRTSHGLPIGLQVMGPYLEDLTTIAFAELLEREYGGFTPPPDFP